MEPYIGQIQPFAFNFPPRGWSQCNGQLLAIASYTALFSLIGTTFGGDGRTSFALPDLRGRSIVHIGTGPGLDTITWGERGGKIYEQLSVAHLPSHDHMLVNGTAKVTVANATGQPAAESDGGANAFLNGGTAEIYSENTSLTDHAGGVTISGNTSFNGGSQAFNIRNPFLGIEMCIAMTGIFPSRN